MTRGSRRRPIVLSLLIVVGLFAGSAPLALDGVVGTAAALTGCSRTASSASSLQYLINNVPSGSTICLTANVSSTSPIRIRRSNVAIDGRGYALKGVGYHTVLELHCASSVTVRNLKVAGSNPRPGIYTPDRQHGHGVSIRGGRSIRLDGVRVWNVQGDAFYLSSCSSTWADGVLIRNSLASWTSRHGIGIVAARNVRVENMTFKNIAFHAIDIEPDWNSYFAQGATDVTFTGGVAYGWVGRFLDGTSGTTFAYIGTPYGARSGQHAPVVQRIIVSGLRVVDARFGIWSEINPSGGYRVNSVTFSQNRGSKRWWTASRGVITCHDTDGFSVTGNSQPVTVGQGMYMARSVNCSNASASGNTGDGLVGQIRN